MADDIFSFMLYKLKDWIGILWLQLSGRVDCDGRLIVVTDG